MKFLKGLALTLLSFLLFLSLSIFSVLFLLNSTILNPSFITAELDRFEVSSLTETIISEQVPAEEFPEELREAIVDTVTRLEPVVKEQVNAAIHSTYDYLLGKRDSPELAQMLGDTFLNSDFVAALIDELDIASLAEEIISEQTEEFPAEFRDALVDTITRLEPQLKEQVAAAADPIFAYLLGESQSLDLAQTLRATLLSSDFVVALVDELDIASLAGDFISEQIAGELSAELPEELEFMVEALDDTLVELEPWLKEQLTAAADPILDYLLGESQSLSIAIPLEPVMEILQDNLKEAFLESPPPGFEDLPQSALEPLIDELFQGLSAMLPATFEIDESLLGTEIQSEFAGTIAEAEASLTQARQDIAMAIAEAEQGLEEGRRYVGYFQLGYNLFIVFMLLLILGIVLIHRQVKGATRGLGITSLTFGAIELIGVFAARYFAGIQLTQLPPLPDHIQTWLPQFLNSFLAPLQWLSIGLVVAGIALLVASFVYKPGREQNEL